MEHKWRCRSCDITATAYLGDVVVGTKTTTVIVEAAEPGPTPEPTPGPTLEPTPEPIPVPTVSDTGLVTGLKRGNTSVTAKTYVNGSLVLTEEYPIRVYRKWYDYRSSWK